MPLPVWLQRVGYRVAFRILQVVWLLTRPRVNGVKCVLTDGERILLVRHTYGNRRWDLPGGGIKGGEEPLAAAQREMREELGIESAQWSDLGQVHKNVDHRRDTVHCFQARLVSSELRLNLAELAAAEWFERPEIPPRLAPYVQPVLERLARAPAG